MTLTTQTPKQNTAADLEAELEHAQNDRQSILHRLATVKRGQVQPSPGALGRADERIAVLAAKLEIARDAAANEQHLLPTEEQVEEALGGVAGELARARAALNEASEAVEEAVANLRIRVSEHNDLITRTRANLRSIRLPETGSELNDLELGYAENRLQYAGWDHGTLDERHLAYFLGALGKAPAYLGKSEVSNFVSSVNHAAGKGNSYLAEATRR